MPATYDSIATVTLSDQQAQITFSGISGAYTDLVLVCNPRANNNNADLRIRVNNDSASNYNWQNQKYHGDEPSTYAVSSSNTTSFSTVSNVNNTNFNPSVVHIMNYASGTGKVFISRTTVPGYMTSICTGNWRSTSAITSVTVLLSGGIEFVANTTFSLYGITRA